MLNRRNFLRASVGLSAVTIFPYGLYKPLMLKDGINNSLPLKHTFDNFVVGNSNKIAYSAALEVSNKPGKKLNPLFIYSMAGLGKTHLLMAIKNQLLSRNFTKTIYTDSENYCLEFCNAIQRGKINDFRNKYRGADALLLDETSCLGRKERTQEELLYTYNSLFESGKQIVFAGQKLPAAIHYLDDRLLSRFNSGLIVIHPPEIETSIDILKKIAERESFSMPDDVIFFIASNFGTSIRHLEGAFRRVAFASTVTGEKISINFAEGHLKYF